MKKVIGIVGEGPIDQMVLKAVVNRITNESNIFRFIQPEQDMRGEFGNGWKGVYRWCEKNAEMIPALFSKLTPALDLLIIQMDGDVARKEKEVHCHCEKTVCSAKFEVSPLDCQQLKIGRCPIVLPCEDHEVSSNGYRGHLEKMLSVLLRADDYKDKVIIVIPCDSTDAWTVAAYEDGIQDIESIVDPWDRIISLKKEYHGIRIPGHKKSTAIYRMFLPQIVHSWENLTEKCRAAKELEKDIKKWLG